MKILPCWIGFSITIFAFILGLILSLVPKGERSTLPDQKPSVYITRTDAYRTIEGKDMWLMEYTVDGILQGTMFNSQEAMTEYREYLETIGRVYQREINQ
jgi:hypothetical protein